MVVPSILSLPRTLKMNCWWCSTRRSSSGVVGRLIVRRPPRLCAALDGDDLRDLLRPSSAIVGSARDRPAAWWWTAAAVHRPGERRGRQSRAARRRRAGTSLRSRACESATLSLTVRFRRTDEDLLLLVALVGDHAGELGLVATSRYRPSCSSSRSSSPMSCWAAGRASSERRSVTSDRREAPRSHDWFGSHGRVVSRADLAKRRLAIDERRIELDPLPRARRDPSPESPTAARACRDAAGSAKMLAGRRPTRRSCPRYITATRVQM